MELPQDACHNSAVATIAERVRLFYANKTAFRVYHGSTNSTRKSPYRQDNTVDTSGLQRVLDVRTNDRIAFVEPNVPMDKLVRETRKYGFIPPVVMEFPGITAGGGFAGTSGESSSFKYGLFDRTVKTVEMVLGNGEVVFASDTVRPDLFRGAACSCGTLGVVTMLGIELVPVRPYVALRYITVGSMDEALERMRSEQDNETLDYMDGVFFSKNHGALCLGELVSDVPPGQEVTRFSRPQDDWFYINARKRSIDHKQWTEYIPIEDYLFRYDRGAFWMGKYTYRYFAIPLTRFTRWLLDRWTHTRMMYHALHQSGLSDKFIIQDVAIPFETSSEFFSYLDATFQNYPIWICPLRVRGKSDNFTSGLLASEHHSSAAIASDQPLMMLNFGVWGPGPEDPDEFITWNKAFESKVTQVGGRKWLYAHVYFTAKQFWDIYDFPTYDQLRKKYNALHLPSLYEKVKHNGEKQESTEGQSWILQLCTLLWSIWPIAGLYGWLQCVIAKEYLMS